VTEREHLAAETAEDTHPVAIELPDGTCFDGPIIDLRGVDTPTSSESIVEAIRVGCPTRPDQPTVHAPPPTQVHAHVVRLHPETEIDRTAALAAVGAVRGIETAHDDELAAARESLRSLSTPAVDVEALRAARRRAAEAGSETERLRERVATLRGEVTALREAGDGDAVADAEASLSEATRELSEASTERVAATQRLSMLEARAQRARDERETRLRLEDRVENLERAVRCARADAVGPEFRDARRQIGSLVEWAAAGIPGADTPAGLRDALAVAVIAPFRAPVVVDPAVVDAIGGRDAVETLLGTPLVLR
jgi:hypothetical protein